MEHTEFQQFLPDGSSLAPLPLPPLPLGYASQFGPEHAAPRKPGVWMVFVVWLVAIVVMLGASVFVAFAYAAIHRPADPANTEPWREQVEEMIRDPAGLIAMGVASQISFLIVTLCAAWMSPMGVVRRLRLGKSSLPWAGYAIVPVGMLALTFLFDALVRLLHVPQGGNLELLHDVFARLTPGQMLAAWLVIGVMPGIAEEFMFRGYIQSRIAVRWGRWIAILIAALLFGISHFDRLQSPATFLMGIYLGYMVERSGSIRPSMFCHMFNNSFALVVSRLAARAVASAPAENASPAAVVVQGLIALAVLGGCCTYLRFRVHPPAELSLGEPGPG